jgi:hypothetical protein
MPVSSPTFRPIVQSGPANVEIFNAVVTTDYPLAIPDKTQQIILKATNASVLTIKKTLLGPTFTIPANCVFQLSDIEVDATVLYISSSIASTTIEAIMLY